MKPPLSFDLIWAGSVMTHLSAEVTTNLLRRFASWLNPGGLAVAASMHGPHVRQRLADGVFYIQPDRVLEIMSGYDRSGLHGDN